LFVPVNNGGKLDFRRMTDQAVFYVLQRRAEDAGVKRFSPHDLRRTSIGDLLAAARVKRLPIEQIAIRLEG
jgi:integrase